MTNDVSEATRRDIFDSLRLEKVAWEGRLSELDFLTRIFDLSALPSHDSRCSNMLGDVNLHRETFRDWDDDWVYDDGRLNLLRCPDETFFRFICEMVHPLIRADEAEVDRLLSIFNTYLPHDGFQITPKAIQSGRRIFVVAPMMASPHMVQHARAVADELGSRHVADQVARMESAITSDPALAIGSAKEFLESMCKAILSRRGCEVTGKENLPRLVQLTRQAIGLVDASPGAEGPLKITLSALATVTQGIAELRGQLGTGHGADPATVRPRIEVAKLVVGAATTLGVFLWETHEASKGGLEG